jgi:hypothetical protein
MPTIKEAASEFLANRPTADRGHKVRRAVFTLTGNVPREV